MLSAKGNASFTGFGPKGAAAFDFSGHERKKCFLNDRGQRLVDVSYFSGLDSDQDGRTVVQADLDHDGNPELLVAMRDHPLFHVYARSPGEPPHHALAFDVRMKAGGNRDAVGAEVRAHCGGHAITRLVAVGTGFAGQDAHLLTLGTGDCKKLDSLVVRWPNGLEKTFQEVQADGLYTVDEEKLHFVGWLAPPKEAAPVAAAAPAVAGRALVQAMSGVTAIDADGRPRVWAPSHDLIYLDLWASWCDACKRTQPVVDALAARFAGRLEVVGLSMDPADELSAIKAHARETRYPLLSGPGLLPAAASLVGDKPALPSTLVLRRSTGEILWSRPGVPSVSDLEALLSR